MRIASIMTSAALAALFAAAIGPAPSEAAEPFDVTVILPLTGAAAFLGQGGGNDKEHHDAAAEGLEEIAAVDLQTRRGGRIQPVLFRL